ncbi:MAG: hypothetical protein NT061_09965, partial [Spirochaetes bacterium]|nr:hypothetical protein [Spirochaetota bacterium]
MISNCWKGIRPIKRALPSASGSPAGRRKAARLFCLSLFCLALPFLAAAQGILPQHKTLANGLDIVVLPIPSTDRISLSLVFRGGAEGQNSKTAGYPRLVERVLFRGSVSNPGEPEPAGAMEALAPLSTTGGTDRDRFSLGFSVAPEILGQGLDTLALLFSELRRESAFSDPAALKEAKSASLAEIARKSDDPSTIYESALSKKLFSTAPWRLDPLGSPT